MQSNLTRSGYRSPEARDIADQHRGMRVADLIALLKTCDPTAPVLVDDPVLGFFCSPVVRIHDDVWLLWPSQTARAAGHEPGSRPV